MIDESQILQVVEGVTKGLSETEGALFLLVAKVLIDAQVVDAHVLADGVRQAAALAKSPLAETLLSNLASSLSPATFAVIPGGKTD